MVLEMKFSNICQQKQMLTMLTKTNVNTKNIGMEAILRGMLFEQLWGQMLQPLLP